MKIWEETFMNEHKILNRKCPICGFAGGGLKFYIG